MVENLVELVMKRFRESKASGCFDPIVMGGYWF
jgi:hypothetical protein